MVAVWSSISFNVLSKNDDAALRQYPLVDSFLNSPCLPT